LSELCGKLAALGAVLAAFAPPALSSGQLHWRDPSLGIQPATLGQAAPEGDKGSRVLEGITGLDFSSLSPSAKQELASVFSDEFCYCGCPHTLGACLKTHPTCQHARRMAVLAAAEASSGAPAVEIITHLSKYYLSFREPRLSLKVDDRLCTGKKEAKVTMVEFSDFECPHCAAARPILETFARTNANSLRFCFSPFPLAGHLNSIPAAQAALFARDHGKFWQMHDLLFENQKQLNPELFKSLASRIGLSPAELSKALEAQRYADELNLWKESGSRANVDATPTLYINGRKYLLPIGVEALQHTVEDEIEWISNKNSWAPD
jgi:predicted DsbA family dithiol-disulfide isomerase